MRVLRVRDAYGSGGDKNVCGVLLPCSRTVSYHLRKRDVMCVYSTNSNTKHELESVTRGLLYTQGELGDPYLRVIIGTAIG